MHDRTRMFRTLVSLVVAMTATTALLGWIDPSAVPSPSTPTVEDVLPIARSLVADGLRYRHAEWRSVQVRISTPTMRSERWLAASPDGGDHHFAVDDQGRSSNTALWLAQAPVEALSATIVVHLIPHRDHLEPTDAQVNAARALVLALNELAGPPDVPLVVATPEP